MYLNTIERAREMGIIRSLGMTRSQLRAVIILEGLALCAVGTVAGLVYATYQLGALSRGIEYFAGIRMSFMVPYGALGLAALVGVVVSAAGSIYPAHRAAYRDITESLRCE